MGGSAAQLGAHFAAHRDSCIEVDKFPAHGCHVEDRIPGLDVAVHPTLAVHCLQALCELLHNKPTPVNVLCKILVENGLS